jgi:prepilin-type N-terminal cleavage/methylation domain-containing protein
MSKVLRLRASEAGYSLIEMMVTLGILGVLTGMAVVTISGSRPAALGDGAMRVVLSQMNTAREMAITQRRNMRVSFTLGNLVTISREEVPGPTLTIISSVLMEGGLQFLTVANLPDTPDAFCGGVITAVSFPTATGTPPEVKFRPDGTFVNQDGLILNGTVFVALPSQSYTAGNSTSGVMSARGVTVLGSTGRVRGYRFDGHIWQPV